MLNCDSRFSGIIFLTYQDLWKFRGTMGGSRTRKPLLVGYLSAVSHFIVWGWYYMRHQRSGIAGEDFESQ